MEFTVENRDDFLDFLRDFAAANDGVQSLIVQLKQESSVRKINSLYQKIKNIVTEAQLMNIRPLIPFFDPLLRISGSVADETTPAEDAALTLISSIFSSLDATTRQWEAKLSQPDIQTPIKIAYALDAELLARTDALSTQWSLEGMLDESNAAPPLPDGMIADYVSEGFAFLSSLQSLLADGKDAKALAAGIHLCLSMLKGNNDLLTSLLPPGASSGHPGQRVDSIVRVLLKIAETAADTEVAISDDLFSLFADSFAELETLFRCLRDATLPDDDHSPLIDRLKEQYHALCSLEKGTGVVGTEHENEDVRHAQEASGAMSPPPPDRPNQPQPPPPQEETFIPIKLERLEDMGNLVGELFVEKNSFVNLRAMIYQNDIVRTDALLKKTEDGFQRIIADLDSVVMKMRLQKVKTLFQRFPRMVRDLSKKLGKEVDLTFSGEDTEIDNRILGAVTDPLMHLVRNAMDHGVEMPDKREKAGKNRKGTIQLSAKNMDNRILIEIFDDGNGIDPVVIKKKALEKGVIAKHEANTLTDRQARELIFHPGFSTADEVTEVSGRGVGMDVVIDNIRKINGSITLDSETGKYSRITLSLPATISVSRGLKICFGNDSYLLPMDAVVKMISIETTHIHRTPASVFVETGGAVYPVLPLNSSMGYPSPVDADHESISLVLVQNEKKKACIAVDRIMGIEDIVVKPLPAISSELEDFYSGCSILPDGSIVLIINIDDYLNRGTH